MNPLQIAYDELKKSDVSDFEIYSERKSSLSIDAKDAAVDTLTQSGDVGLSIRALWNGRMGFSFTTSLDPAAIQRTVRSAIDVARVMPVDSHQVLHRLTPREYASLQLSDPDGPKVPTEKKVALALELEAKCRKADPRITGVRNAAFRETIYEVSIMDSSGQQASYEGTMYSGVITCKSEGNGEQQIGHDFDFAHRLSSLNLDLIARRAAENATELLGAEAPPTMKCAAVLRNDVVVDLLEFLSSSFSAEQIDKGRSLMAGKLGKKVFSETITLIDDGLLPGGYATGPFDGEGVAARKTTVLDRGVFKTPVYNLYYAHKHGQKPTGTASRSIKSPPSIGFSNLYLPAGTATREQLVGGISKGVLITSFMGTHTANPVTGDFSFGASGILIEGGKLTRPVRGFAVAGNLLQLFNQISDVGSDLRYFGSMGAPSIRVQELSVGGK